MKRSLFIWVLLLFAGMDSGVLFAQKQPQQYIDSIMQELKPGIPDTTVINLYNELSFSYGNINPDSGLAYGHKALEMSMAQHWRKGMEMADNSIGMNYLALSDHPKALQYFTNALKLYGEQSDRKGIAAIRGNIALVYAQQGNYPQALAYMKQALQLHEELGDKNAVARMNGNISNIYADESDYAKAIEYNFKALNTYEEMGDKNGVARILDNNAIIYYNIGNYKRALEYHFKALHMQEALGNKSQIPRIYGNIGNVYRDMKDYARANEFYQKALPLYEQMGNQEGVAVIANNMGGVYLQNKQYEAALTSFFRALEIASATGDKSGQASASGNIGEVYYGIAGDTARHIAGNTLIANSKAANLDKAVDYLQKGISIAAKISYVECLQEFNLYLSEAYRLQGNYKQALEAYTAYNTAKDSIAFNEHKIKIATLETRRELELKDKQIELDRLAVAKKRNERIFYIAGIALLLFITGSLFRNYRSQKKSNRSLSAAKEKIELRTEELKQSNAELNTTLSNLQKAQQELIVAAKQKENELIRSRISRDIHDDISAELTRISWVSELAKAKAGKAEYKEVPGLLEKITDSSRETVAKLGEIIWTINPQNDTLERLLVYMRNYIGKFLADTALRYTISFPENGTDIFINPELKRNLFLVMKEVLNNTVKYAQATAVDISFVLNGTEYEFTITDNGKGFEQGVVQGTGNGLANIRTRMKHAHGNTAISTEAGHGTSVCCKGMIY